ncbi:hypothetical protein M3E13_13470 [Oceanobacillus kimchii]|uniref:CD3337/EF1877 family mobilome membrane protein n=1 Tax=Oceanobacillus kimchii TaxID=746691 RepID=UPI0021A30DA5|nr:hypothetical protein [Oceanobacillus kimchii]MCT1577301.1 hypothetical protein [Oceanobacillus kimchii]MCT2136907.1 hypothetical protein [Oceanobacillus kimchii]
MNIKKLVLSFITIGLLVVLVVSVPTVYADDSEYMERPRVEEDTVNLLIERYDLNRYKVNNEDEENRFKSALISLNNGMFQITSFVVEMVDTALDHMFSIDMLNEFADDISNISYQMYVTLKTNFGEMLFVFACGYIIWLAFSKGTFRESIRRSILFIAVLVVAGYWTFNTGTIIKVVNNISNEAQTKIIDTGNSIIDIIDDGSGVFSDTSTINTGSTDETVSGTLTVMRNLYFDLAYERPYLFMNYGDVNKEEINNHDLNGDELSIGSGFNRVDRLLAFKNTKDAQEMRLEYVENDEVEALGNTNMGGGNAYSQLGIAFLSPFLAIGLGIPFFILASFNFIIQLFIILILFCIPFAFILSYIPQFAMSGFKMIGYLFTAFAVKIILSLFVLFVYLMCYLVDTFLAPTNIGMYLLNVAVLVVLLFFMIIKRDMIVKVVTAGRVQSLDSGFMNNVNQKMVNPTFEKIKDKLTSRGKTNEEVSPVQNPNINANRNNEMVNGKGTNVNRTPQGKDGEENKGQDKGFSVNRREDNNRTPQGNKEENKDNSKENKEMGQEKQPSTLDEKPQGSQNVEGNTKESNENEDQDNRKIERTIQKELEEQKKPSSVGTEDRKVQMEYVDNNQVDVEREKPKAVHQEKERPVQQSPVVDVPKNESQSLHYQRDEKLKNKKPSNLPYGTYEIERNKMDLTDSKGKKE